MGAVTAGVRLTPGSPEQVMTVTVCTKEHAHPLQSGDDHTFSAGRHGTDRDVTITLIDELEGADPMCGQAVGGNDDTQTDAAGAVPQEEFDAVVADRRALRRHILGMISASEALLEVLDGHPVVGEKGLAARLG